MTPTPNFVFGTPPSSAQVVSSWRPTICPASFCNPLAEQGGWSVLLSTPRLFNHSLAFRRCKGASPPGPEDVLIRLSPLGGRRLKWSWLVLGRGPSCEGRGEGRNKADNQRAKGKRHDPALSPCRQGPAGSLARPLAWRCRGAHVALHAWGSALGRAERRRNALFGVGVKPAWQSSPSVALMK